MKIIHLVIDETLLQKVDQAARDQKISRSQFIQNALKEAYRKFFIQRLEQIQLEGYRQFPVKPEEFNLL